MSVGNRGYTQETYDADGSQTLAWPSGTVAGDFAVVRCDHMFERGDPAPGPVGSGWTPVGADTYCWAKRLTTADVASGLPVRARLAAIVAFTGAGATGRVSSQPGVSVQAGGAALYFGWTTRHASSLGPATDRQGTIVTYPTDGHLHGVWAKTSASATYLELESPTWRASYRGIEIVPLAGPESPTVTAPAPGAEADHALPITVAWTHNSAQGGTQTKCKVRVREVGSGTWYYVTTSGTITTTETELTQSDTSVTIAASTLTADQAYDLEVYTFEDTWSGASAAQTFTARTAPTVDTITVDATLDDLTPVVDWTATMGVGSQTSWRVRITVTADTSPANAIWDSGIQTGAGTSANVPALVGDDGGTSWVNGAGYKAWVEVQQTGGLWSEVSPQTFTVSWTEPSAPSSVTPANQTTGPLQVTVAGITSGLAVQVQRYDSATSTWVALADDPTPGTTLVLDVPLAPYGIAWTYRARTYDTVDGVKIPSAWTASAAVASTDTAAYFVAVDGLTYLEVTVKEDRTRRLVQGVTVSYGLGGSTPRVDRGPTAGEAGSTTLETWDPDDRDAVVAWLTETDSWWLRWSPELGTTRQHVPATLMALAGGVSWDRLAQLDITPRLVSFDWVEQTEET